MLRTARDAGPVAGPWPTTPTTAPPPARVALPALDARPVCDRLLVWIDGHRWWLWAFVAACYLAAFNGQWRVQPDAALYLGIGRNIAEGHGYTFRGHADETAYPGWPLAIAAVYKVAGDRSAMPAANGLMLLVAAGTIAATYRLVLLHAGRPTAVTVAVGTAVTKSFFVYALELWSDLPFALGAMAMLAGYEGAVGGRPGRRGRWYDWALLIGGLAVAVATRPTGWVLLAALVGAVAVDAVRGRVRWSTLAGGACVVASIAVVCVVLDPRRQAGHGFGGRYEQYVLDRLAGAAASPLDHSLAEKLYVLFATAASDVLFQVRFGDLANSCLSAVVLLLGVCLFRLRPLWGLWFTLLVGTTVLLVQEVLDRYFLPVLPLLVYGWWSLLVWVDRRPVRPGWPRRALNVAFLVLAGFGAMANLTKVFGIVGQQRSRPFLTAYDKGRYQPVPALSAAIGRQVGPDGVVLVKPPYGRVVAFLSRRSALTGAEARATPLGPGPVFVVEPTDPAVREQLDRAGLTVGPAVYTSPPPPASSAKGEQLSLHTTVRRSAP